jgi:pimeloyl-ACP methyl ester carboxylesterase
VTSRIAQWTLDVQDVGRMAEFWSHMLGYEIDVDRDDDTHVLPPGGDGLWPARAIFAETTETTETAETASSATLPPSTYVLPTEDRTLTPDWMRRAARQRLRTDAVEVPGGHCPHASRPEQVATLLDR